MKMSQADKAKRGASGEAAVTKSLAYARLWNHKLVNAGYGTLFDKLVIERGGGWAMEIKTRKKPTIGYNEKSITPNERRGLNAFMERVGEDRAVIIGIWRPEGEPVGRAFVIPWASVRDAVESGRRGSINMLEYQEIPRKGAGWDMSIFGGGSCK